MTSKVAIIKFLSGLVAVHCKTRSSAKALCDFIDLLDIKGKGEVKLSENTKYELYGSNTCYYMIPSHATTGRLTVTTPEYIHNLNKKDIYKKIEIINYSDISYMIKSYLEETK